MKRFGVIGHPIAHSLSPLLHNTAFGLLGLECSYESFDVEPVSLRTIVSDLKSRDFAGLNVTIPHKEKIVALVDDLSEESKLVGAVNTLSFNGNRIRGDNTDVYGIAATLRPYGGEIRDRLVLLVGAGGSARAIVYALIDQYSPAEIVFANRSPERAAELMRDFGPRAKGTSLRSITMEGHDIDSVISRACLIVNATPVGMYPAVDESPLSDQTKFQPGQIVMDTIYTPLETNLLAKARACGARTISGLEMFLHQGARSFEIWLDRQMPLDRLRQVILDELKIRSTSSKN